MFLRWFEAPVLREIVTGVGGIVVSIHASDPIAAGEGQGVNTSSRTAFGMLPAR